MKKIKLLLINDDMILHTENQKESTKITTRTNEFSKVAEYIINIQNSTIFLNTNSEQP